MSRKLPPLDALLSFEVASRVLSFTRAAEELHVTPAAVGHRIKTLEERLGTELFYRDNNRIHLTDSGQDLIPVVRQALELLTDATSKVGKREACGFLNVSLLPTFAVRWLIPRLAEFRRAYAEVQLQLATSYRPVDFAREDCDAAVRYGKGDWPDLESVALFNEELVPVCSPALVEPSARLRGPDELARFTLLHSATCLENWPVWLEAAGASNVDPEDGLHFDSCLLTLQAAQDGLGMAVANREYVARDLEAGRLVAPFELTVEKDTGWHFVCPKATAQQPKIAAFRDWLLTQVPLRPLAVRA